MSEDDFTLQIEAGTPEVLGADPEPSRLLQIRVPLEPPLEPPTDLHWCKIFNEIAPEVSYALHHPPEAESSAISGKTTDSTLQEYVAYIRERVAATNEHYNQFIAPELRAEAEEREAEQELEQLRLEEARRKLEEL